MSNETRTVITELPTTCPGLGDCEFCLFIYSCQLITDLIVKP